MLTNVPEIEVIVVCSPNYLHAQHTLLAEKKRVRWKREDTEFDIDFYPLLEPYLEIETTSWEKIDEAIQLLGLNSEDKKMFSANQVYALKGIKVSEMQSITFANGAIKK